MAITRMLAAALLIAALASPVAAQAPKKTAATAEVVARIAAIKAPRIGNDFWDLQAELIILEAYDADNSKIIDTEAELAAIPCEVWQQIDKMLRTRKGRGTDLITSYGFGPKGDYFGHQFGVTEKLRNSAHARILACGVKAGR